MLLQLRKNPMYENSFANILHFLENRKSLLRFLLKKATFYTLLYEERQQNQPFFSTFAPHFKKYVYLYDEKNKIS